MIFFAVAGGKANSKRAGDSPSAFGSSFRRREVLFFREFPMFFAVPVVGKVLASYAASEISDNISTAQKTAQARLQASGAGSVDPAAFAQALNNFSQAVATQPSQAASAFAQILKT
jgi:hypothetical protein